MEIRERLERLHEHVQKHPKDYQSVIAEMIMRSDYIEHEIHEKSIVRLREIAEIRKRRREYAEQNE